MRAILLCLCTAAAGCYATASETYPAAGYGYSDEGYSTDYDHARWAQDREAYLPSGTRVVVGVMPNIGLVIRDGPDEWRGHPVRVERDDGQRIIVRPYERRFRNERRDRDHDHDWDHPH